MAETKIIYHNCQHCGVKLNESTQWFKRKYCSRLCRERARQCRMDPNRPHKLWVHEKDVFETAMELHWNGEESASIARKLEIPVGTVYSWVHDFGNQQQRKEPLKKLLQTAKSAEEWLCALRKNTVCEDVSFENLTVSLVCGKHHGQSVDKLSTVIYESLKENISCGKIYAFCNKTGNTITTIVWVAPIFNIARYIKTSGTFIWPHENLGLSIEITKAEFDRLLFLKKHEKVCDKVQKRLISCGFHDIIKA